jgi:acetylglutamate kinase
VTLVVKLGGSTLAAQTEMLADITALVARGERVVVVHGGGAAVSRWMERLGLTPTFKDGLRVTDAPTLEVVRMVLAGTINQQLVAVACRLGAPAIGLTGLDGGLLQARRADGELGFVGEIVAVRAGVLEAVLAGGYLPIVAPLGVEASRDPETGDSLAPVIYNINADVAAGAIAGAVGARAAVFLTDVPGVRGPDGTVVPRASAARINQMIEDGVIAGGMIPKVRACLDALEGAASAVILDGRQPHSLRDWAAGATGGTNIHKQG